MKFEARACVNVTIGFEVEADSENEAEQKIHEYLPYVQYGKLDKQPMSVKVDDGDKVTGIFIMETEVVDTCEA